MPCCIKFPIRFSIAIALLLAFVVVAPAQAAFIGNPAPQVAGAYTFRHSLELDRSERKLVTSRWNSPVTMRTSRITARESYGVTAWRDLLIEISGIFGISRSSVDFGTVDLAQNGSNLLTAQNFWNTFAPGVSTIEGRGPLNFDGGYGPVVGAALRTRLWEWRGIALSVGGQVTYASGMDTGLPTLDLAYTEWDGFAGASWERRFFSFYAGVSQSLLVGEMSTQSPDIGTDLAQERALGAFAGSAFHFYRHWDIVGELRLVNPSSFSRQVMYEF